MLKTDRHSLVRKLQLFWVVGRLPLSVIVLLCLIAFASLREPIVDVIARIFNIWWFTVLVIWYASTPLTRLLLAIGTAAGFFLIQKAGEKIGGCKGYLAGLAAASVMTLIVLTLFSGNPSPTPAVLWTLALNAAPLCLLTRIGLNRARINFMILLLPVISEFYFAGRYLTWVRAKMRGVTPIYNEESPKLPGAILAALLVVEFCPADRLVEAERYLRAGSQSRVFARGDYNGLAYNAANDRLYATGHGVNAVLSYDASNPDAGPITASAQSGGAQGLDLDTTRGELYVFSAPDSSVQVFDANTLSLVKTIPARDVSPGDSWIEHEPITNTFIIASETDLQIGRSLLVLDRTTHAVVDDRIEEAGNMVVRPGAPMVYLSCYRNARGVFAYDVRKKAIVARASTAVPIDRMAWDPKHGELLATAPSEGTVYRFDPDTLELRGTFSAIFGVRVISIDAENDVMLVGSLATGKVALMGLVDRKLKRSWYVGPWLRSIVTVPNRGIAFVSSQTALYSLRYLDLSKP